MKIVIVGMGYVGIPIAALLANVKNFKVIGIQRRSNRSGWKIDHLNEGLSPIGGDEPGLSELIMKVVKTGSFKATDDFSTCKDADIILIAVQTPIDDKHTPRFESLKAVTSEIGKYMRKGVMIIIESTISPGTTEHIVKPILEQVSNLKAGGDFNLIFSPERVMAGRLIYNIVNMPRIIGGLTRECAKRGMEFYKNVVKADLYPTDCLTAEVSKLTENAYRDVNIAFSNEIALICESLGVNVHDVRRFVNALPFDPSDPAKNPYRMMHIPGAGVGGHCLPKDPWLLKFGLDKYGSFKVPSKLIEESRRVNDLMPNHMKALIEDALKERGVKMRNAKICMLGLAFLQNSDDTRNTPAKPLYDLLKSESLEVIVHDPYVTRYENIEIIDNLEDAVSGRDCIAVVTPHREYDEIQLDWLKEVLRTPIIVDGRNVFNPLKCIESGFTFRGVGIGLKRKYP